MVFFLIVILMPGIPPRTTFPFKAFSIPATKDLSGALELNYHLEGAERLLDGRVYGPEALVVHKNEIYTGIHGGEIIKISAEHVTHVAKIGQPCEDISEESRCGRPLGLAFDTQNPNKLIVADAYYGIWEVEISSGKKKLLVSPQQELPGKTINRPAKIFNSVAIDKRGDIYWTDSSSDFTIQDLVFTAFANPSGRLFKYDRSKNQSEVLIDEIYFANGIALSPNEDFIVVSETGANRLLKYNIKGPKAGQVETFVDGLPGHTDNLTPDSEGLWVPLVMATDSEHPSGFVIFSEFPMIRLFLARLMTLFEMPFRLANTYFPNKISQRFIHFIGHGESILLLSPKRSTVVRVDWNGNIVGSLHGFDKSVGSVSHVLELEDQLLLGSPFNRFLARVKSPKASAGAASKKPSIKVQNVRYEGVIEPVVKPNVEATKATTTAKPTTTTTTTTTTPKPTTTTAKPTTTTTTTTTPRPTTTAKPKTTTMPKPKPTTTTTTAKPPQKQKRVPPKEPAPVKEEIPSDTKPPKQETLKVRTKQGEHIEL